MNESPKSSTSIVDRDRLNAVIEPVVRAHGAELVDLELKNESGWILRVFVEKLGAKPRRIASLYIGRREGRRLLYAGKVRSGYTESTARDVRERLDPLIVQTSPLSHPIKAKLEAAVYHLPGMQNYTRTRPDRCYASEAAARRDGLSPARR